MTARIFWRGDGLVFLDKGPVGLRPKRLLYFVANIKLSARRDELPPAAGFFVGEDAAFPCRAVRFPKKGQAFFDVKFVGFGVDEYMQIVFHTATDFVPQAFD